MTLWRSSDFRPFGCFKSPQFQDGPIAWMLAVQAVVTLPHLRATIYACRGCRKLARM